MRVLVTGASGFVGSRLGPELAAAGHEVLAMTRNPDRYQGTGRPVRGDVHDADSVAAALQGCDAAYYLVHSLADADFEQRDAEAARAFAAAAADAGLERIVYLGGLGEDGDELSAHLRSRREVEHCWAPRACRSPRCGPDHRRARRHLLGDDPPARRAPAGDDHSPLGAHPDPADRGRRRGPLPGRRAGACRRRPGGRSTSAARRSWIPRHVAPGRRHRRPQDCSWCRCRCSRRGCPRAGCRW